MSRPGYPKIENSSESYSFTYWFDDDGSVAYHASGSESYRSRQADSAGANSPGYPVNKPVNTYVGYNATQKFNPGFFTGSITPFAGRSQHGSGTYPSSSLCSLRPLDNFNNDTTAQNRLKLSSRLQTNLKSQKINVGVAAAEFHKTCATVTSSATRIANAFEALRRGNMKHALNTLTGGGATGSGRESAPNTHGGRGTNSRPNTGSVAKDWLSLQYGWMPLLSDVYGGAEELARTISGRPTACSVRSKAVSSDYLSVETSPTNFSSPKFSGVRKIECTSIGVIEYRITDSLASLAANTGVTNPLSVAWELIPYSFVVDWFLPVGTFLNNLDFDNGIEFSRGWMSHKTKATWRLKMVSGTYGFPDNNQTWSGGSVEGDAPAFERDLLSSFPSLTVPQWRNPLSLQHVENALALLRTAFR
jgi:hypothetical protein